ncbi:LPXTG cell wall anchor domain-containing protein, partial [Streptomyces sp. IBSBF 2806]|uniref:LPXTG cell wall anchor domain-containing protein n=1 Tax=Streptomyces sp. IBSBF 2806 TaxID=2903529 RepID=UPI002FDC437F
PTPGPDPSGRLSLADEAEELARTGLTSPGVLVAAAGCLLAAGAALLLARRRR